MVLMGDFDDFSSKFVILELFPKVVRHPFLGVNHTFRGGAAGETMQIAWKR